MRNAASYGAHIFNNTLTNITDKDQFDNPQADAQAGLQAPSFRCGAMAKPSWKDGKRQLTEKNPRHLKGPASGVWRFAG